MEPTLYVRKGKILSLLTTLKISYILDPNLVYLQAPTPENNEKTKAESKKR